MKRKNLVLTFVLVVAAHLGLIAIPISLGASARRGDSRVGADAVFLSLARANSQTDASVDNESIRSLVKSPDANQTKPASSTANGGAQSGDAAKDNQGDNSASPFVIDLRAYGRSVLLAISEEKKYSPYVKNAKETGTVLVKVAIDRDGNLKGRPEIMRSSGHLGLDNEALRLVAVAAPYEPLPEEFNKDFATINVPIRFAKSW